MSDFVSQLYVPEPVPAVAAALRSLGLRSVVVPCGAVGSSVVADWEDWPKVEAAFEEVWAVTYTDDAPALSVDGYRGGACWLSVQWNPGPADDPYDLYEMLDEEGYFPDGSPGPQLAYTQSLASVQQAQAAGNLSKEVAKWLLSSLEQKRPAGIRRVWRGVAGKLGFGLASGLNVEMLEHLSEQEWEEEYAGAVVV